MWLGILLQGSSSSQFWTEKMNEGGGGSGWATYTYTYTICAIVLMLICQLVISTRFRFAFRSFFFPNYRFRSEASPPSKQLNHPTVSLSALSQLRILQIISDSDLKSLIDNLDEKLLQNEKWDTVMDRRNNFLSYKAKCCKPKDGALKYLSVTVFENCSAEMLRNFYMDNDYRKQWDKTLIEHEQLQVDESNGTEIGCTIKKFPLLTPREYILAWRLWEGRDRTFYCFSKECEHPLAPRQKKYVRVGFFRSGWRISKVPGGNACEIKMVHQEDAGLNVEMAKLFFAKGIWSYVCKMDNALRKYADISHLHPTSVVNAISLIQKVPPELDTINNVTSTTHPETPKTNAICCQVARECSKRNFTTRRPSNKLIANGLILLGGVICLSRSHSNLGVKVAMAYILGKLTKRGASSSPGKQASSVL